MKKLITICCLALFVGGCANAPIKDDFFGVKVASVRGAQKFVIKKFQDGRTSFTTNSNINSDISAWGAFKDWAFERFLRIVITNKTKKPIATNYFLDSFTIFTNNNIEYLLDNGDILDYPKSNVINPNTTAVYYPQLPEAIKNITKENIKMIVCKLGMTRTLIVLKPLPEEIITEHETSDDAKK